MADGCSDNRNIILIAAALLAVGDHRRRLSARRRAEAGADGRPRGHRARPRRAQRHRRPRHLDDQLHRARAPSSAPVQAEIDRDARTVADFFRAAGFPADAVTDAGGSVNQFYDNNRGENVVTINRRLQLRTNDVMRARRAYARQFDLIRNGVAIQEGSGMHYSLHPAQRRQAGDDRRSDPGRAARRRAVRQDSAAPSVGGIRSATQGYFSIGAARRRRRPSEGVRRPRLAAPEGAGGDDDRILPRLRLRLRLGGWAATGCGGGGAAPARRPAPAPRLRAASRGWRAAGAAGIGVGRAPRRPGGRAARPRPCRRPGRRWCRRAAGCRDCRGRARGRGRCRRGRGRDRSARRASAADRYQANGSAGDQLRARDRGRARAPADCSSATSARARSRWTSPRSSSREALAWPARCRSAAPRASASPPASQALPAWTQKSARRGVAGALALPAPPARRRSAAARPALERDISKAEALAGVEAAAGSRCQRIGRRSSARCGLRRGPRPGSRGSAALRRSRAAGAGGVGRLGGGEGEASSGRRIIERSSKRRHGGGQQRDVLRRATADGRRP